MTAKGNLRFHYDYRNRLTRVSLADGSDVATYSYDAFNRLTERTEGSTTEQTAWAGWQPIETYDGSQLSERRTFGLGIDELVRLQIDLDGDGSFDEDLTPLYEQTGNVAAMADSSGEIVERYEYSPYGFRIAAVDSIPPDVLQLLHRAGSLRLELSEEILRAVLAPESSQQAQSTSGGLSAVASASTAPPPISLVATATGEEIPVTVSFPEELGRFAFRRAVITPTATAPDPGTEVTLHIGADGLEDRFFNQASAAYEETFLWPAGDLVLQDGAPPEVESILTRSGYLEIAFSEEVNLATAQAGIEIDGSTVAWEPEADGYHIKTVDPLPAGAQTLTIGTTVQDLAGTPLAAGMTIDLGSPIASAATSSVPVASTASGVSTSAANSLSPARGLRPPPTPSSTGWRKRSTS